MIGSFSALQRAEIAEIATSERLRRLSRSFSALQRAEIAEIGLAGGRRWRKDSFSALQRAEIAEIPQELQRRPANVQVSVLFNEPKLLKSANQIVRPFLSTVSVLFNEPKLLKSNPSDDDGNDNDCFSALQRAEIAEIPTSAPCPTRVPDPDTCTSSLLSLPGVSSQHSYLSMDGRVSQLDFCARTASSCETRCFPFQ